MATKPTRRRTARWLAYCETQLADPTITPERREILEAKAGAYRRQLAGSCRNRCRRCGRELQDPESVEAGLGRDCQQREATS